MSLSTRILIVLSAVVALYTCVDHLLQRVTVLRSFVEFEQISAERDMERVVAAIEEERAQLDELCASRASWDESWMFVANALELRDAEPDEDTYQRMVDRYVRANLDPERLAHEFVDLLFICTTEGEVLWGGAFDPGSRAPIALRDFPTERIDPRNRLIARGSYTETVAGEEVVRRVDHKSGVFLTERGALLVSSRPILTSRGEGPERGTMIVGRFLGKELVATLSQRTKVPFEVWALDSSDLPGEVRESLDAITSTRRPVLREADDEILHAYRAVEDIQKAPALIVRANVARDISKMGAASVEYAWISTLTAGMVLLLVLLGILKRMVLTPLEQLSSNALAIGRNEHGGVRFALDRDDEIGILSREFDDMIEKLARSREALVRTARTAGMSEIATGILHNVGNVLNSVNVSASMLSRQARGLCVDDLEQLSAVLLEHSEDLSRFVAEDPRGQMLQPFVAAIAENLRELRGQIDEEVETLSRGISHIRELVASQQAYAVRTGVIETVSLADQIEEAVSISDKAVAGDPGLRIVRELAELPPVPIDRHKLLEVLVNLVQNARQAMAETGAGDHVLTLRATMPTAERVRIEVRDNGVGIDPEHQLKIFNLGFTTKDRGHGVGLHASANAVREMGGVLTVESAGRGHGATFVLELPLAGSPQIVAA